MNPTARTLLVLGLSLASAAAETSQLRTFTNTQGKAVQAKLVGVSGANVTLETANGQKFTFALASLSAADQQYVKTMGGKAGPNDKLEPASVNEAVGQPLFGDEPLWTSSAEEIAAKLKIPQESKTKNTSSYRSYTKEDYMMFGAHPYSVAMYGENDRVTGFSIVFANKGDLFSAKGSGEMHFDKDTPPEEAAKIVKKAMDKDLVAIADTLTQKLGAPKKERFGEKAGRMNMQRWDWRGHAILLAEAEGVYVGLQIVTTAFADAGGKVEETGDKVIRARVLANLEKRENGDVVVGDLPMVDQGPKGYCVPATAERAMRYLGIPADMYILANAGDSGFGGGTSVEKLLEGVAPQIRSKRRSFDAWKGEMKMKEIAKYIDKGVPLMWTLCSTSKFNETANQRTKERKGVTNWASWKDKVTKESANNALPKDKDTAHIVLIIGYNKDTNEIAFSDSWGERYKERWITLPEAEQVSHQNFYVVGF
ncbi:C39 family peptidase [Prosthecobacter fluviatilis]|uniref:C39 family peptidase n=1 Tax=Prosthecobacter fluviatilis TaxID=445931 RepID=A0ABW0KNG0_9BACT